MRKLKRFFGFIYMKQIWYNDFMDEKLNKRKLIVLDKPAELDEKVEENVTPKISHPGQTNPIYKNLCNHINNNIYISDYPCWKGYLQW